MRITWLLLPGLAAPIHYTVIAGDTLSGIAADFAVRGGWPALYAANRRAIGPDPNLIHSGTMLTVPRPAARVLADYSIRVSTARVHHSVAASAVGG